MTQLRVQIPKHLCLWCGERVVAVCGPNRAVYLYHAFAYRRARWKIVAEKSGNEFSGESFADFILPTTDEYTIDKSGVLQLGESFAEHMGSVGKVDVIEESTHLILKRAL